MYNSKIKLKYLETKSELTQREYRKFFTKSETFERQFNKDLSDFTLNEIQEMLFEIKPKNEPQSKVYCSTINGYRKWVKSTDENIFKDVESDFYIQFV